MSDGLPQRMAVALAIGLLVGLARGWQRRGEAEGSRAAGFRTFALTGLLGGVAGALTTLTGPLTVGLLGLAFTAAFTVFHVLESRRDGDLSATGVIAGLVTYALGAYAVLGEPAVAAVGGVATMALLLLKQPLHRLLARLSWVELRAALILLAMSFLMLPVLPDRPLDPWGAFNPAEIWLFAILVAGLSFVGYVAVRLFGDRIGVALAGLAGGLASSTATTLSLSRLGRAAGGATAPIFAAGILLSGAVMTARVLVVATVVEVALLPALGPPLAAACLVLAGAALVFLWRGGRGDAGVDGAARSEGGLRLHNPLELGTAFKFAALIAVVMAAAELAHRFVGDAGLYVLAGVSGLADVDAITLSLARMAGGEIAAATAATGIGVAVAVNTVVKAALVFGAGGRALALRVAAASAAALAAFAAGFLLNPAA